METIKIRLNINVLDDAVYTYVPQAQDTAVTYTELPELPDESEIDEDSPDYVSVTSLIYTSTTSGNTDTGVTDTKYFKKEKFITSEALKLFIPTFNSFETNLYQEELINDMFVNDIKAGVIPDVIDMEKEGREDWMSD